MPRNKNGNDGKIGILGGLARLAYRAANKVLGLDVTRILWLELAANAGELEEPSEYSLVVGDQPCVIRVLSPDMVDQLTLDREADLEEEFRGRARSGMDFCVAAVRGETVIGYLWFALDSLEGEHNRGESPSSGIAVSLPKGTAFFYKGYVRPEFRGQGVFGQLLRWGPRLVGEERATRFLGTTDCFNAAARASARRAGYGDLGFLARIGGKHCNFLWVSARVLQCTGARFGRSATVRPRRLTSR